MQCARHLELEDTVPTKVNGDLRDWRSADREPQSACTRDLLRRKSRGLDDRAILSRPSE